MAAPGGGGAGGPSVLLIEDDEGDAVLVRACLVEAGLPADDLVWVRTLEQARRALAAEFSCVLVDPGLPDADGLTAIQAVVQAAPDVPVIVLTGRQDATGIDALAIGAQDYLVKDDITADLLDRSVRYATERKRAQRTSYQLWETQLSSAEQARLERGLLPTPLLHGRSVECSTYYQPGRDHAVLGGDFFDVVERPDGLVRAVIGDVMGHGPDEAALGVHLRVAWRSLVLAGIADRQILPTLALLLEAESGGQSGFVTVCDVTVDLHRRIATLRVAGHPAPLRCAHGKTVYLDVEVGRPLGIEPPDAAADPRTDADRWPETVVSLDPGSSLVLYTDGLLDAYASPADDGASLGVEELVAAVESCAVDGATARSWISTIVGGAPLPPVDDTAVVVITTRPPSE